MKGRLFAAVLLLGAMALGGCTSQPVHNIPNAPIEAGLSTQQVKQAILSAGKLRKWSMTYKGENRVYAEVHVRSHKAAVNITYDRYGYSIAYADSTNLDYNGETIHRSFNKWVILLDREINKQLQLAAR